MTLLRRLAAVALVLLGSLLLGHVPAYATHCPPGHEPHPPAVPDDYPCGDPNATPKPKTTPTPAPTPTTAPTPARTATPTRRPAPVTQDSTTAAPIDNVEVPTSDPQATPVIVVDGPVADDEPIEVEQSASASSWIFGFIVGLVVGGFLGRASWGLQRRRRQGIFG